MGDGVSCLAAYHDRYDNSDEPHRTGGLGAEEGDGGEDMVWRGMVGMG
jgi:hypothetical protein